MKGISSNKLQNLIKNCNFMFEMVNEIDNAIYEKFECLDDYKLVREYNVIQNMYKSIKDFKEIIFCEIGRRNCAELFRGAQEKKEDQNV
jgi:hypothetical protein